MINLKNDINTNRFSISLDSEEFLAIMRALYWYQDKLTNQERSRGRDNAEWDTVIFLRQQMGELLKQEAKI